MKLAILFTALVLAAGQHSSAPVGTLRGMYVSSDPEEMGVMVFRPDGVFGYKAPSKHLFYSEEQLPPNKARYRVVAGGRVEVFDLAQGEAPFALEIRESGRILVLTRGEGRRPRTATYQKR